MAYRETVEISERNRREYDDHLTFCPAKVIFVAIDIIEQRHDKTNKMAVRPAKTLSAWASAQSDQCLRCPHVESLGP